MREAPDQVPAQSRPYDPANLRLEHSVLPTSSVSANSSCRVNASAVICMAVVPLPDTLNYTLPIGGRECQSSQHGSSSAPDLARTPTSIAYRACAKQVTMWSLTIPTACMWRINDRAATNLKPRCFRSLLSASDSRDVAGMCFIVSTVSEAPPPTNPQCTYRTCRIPPALGESSERSCTAPSLSPIANNAPDPRAAAQFCRIKIGPPFQDKLANALR